jgi:hypothetical protein
MGGGGGLGFSYFLPLRRKAKIVFLLCGTEIHFSTKTILTTQPFT